MLTVDVHGALLAAGYESHVVQRIIGMLTEAEDAVRRGSDITPVPNASYGSSATGAELGVHARKAHDHVTEAMTRMVVGLETYREGVQLLRRGAHDADEQNAADMTTVSRRAEQVDVSTLFTRGDACTSAADQAACAVPAEGEGR